MVSRGSTLRNRASSADHAARGRSRFHRNVQERAVPLDPLVEQTRRRADDRGAQRANICEAGQCDRKVKSPWGAAEGEWRQIGWPRTRRLEARDGGVEAGR